MQSTSIIGIRMVLAIVLFVGSDCFCLAEGVLPAGAVGYWPGNGDALDRIGTNHGILEVGATFAPGKVKMGFAFTNISDVKIPYSASLAFFTNCSIQVWLKPDAPRVGQSAAIIFGRRSGPYSLQATPESNGGWRVQLDQYTPGVWHSAYMASTIPTNQMIHLLVTWDGSNARFYTNGIFCNQAALATYGDSNTQDFFIGGCNATIGGTETMMGIIDEVAIWNRVLTTNEIASLAAWRMTPQTELTKAVRPNFSDLYPGTNYQLQLSADLNNWTNHGAPFPATNTTMAYPGYWDVADWEHLYFRLQFAE